MKLKTLVSCFSEFFLLTLQLQQPTNTITMRKYYFFIAFAISFAFFFKQVNAACDVPLRRPISPSQPMWIIHIDTWNYADPERIIEMVPEDILPFVCFNLSLSASDNVCNSGSNVCDAWMKATASKRVWTMIQPSSGAHNRFSDTDFSDYERYFKEYPNFLGWNFAEQFWDFGTPKNDGSGNWPTFLQRLNTFVQIYKFCQQYGGYFCTSFTQAFYSADMMPIAYMKRNPEMCRLLTEDPEHFICCEKYTMSSCFLDIESNVVGALVGGYAGNIGIRFDDCGWQYNDPSSNPYMHAAGAVPVMEHFLLDGETVLDGPELVPWQASREIGTSTVGGYTRRNWAWYPQYQNLYMDIFRKVLDGTIRIPSREEVIDRTKIVVKNDIKSNNTDGEKDPFLTPENMFDKLYRWDNDRGGEAYTNHWLDQRWWFKRTGRYPCFPQVYDLLDDYAKEHLTVVNKSKFNTTYSSDAIKQVRFNRLFPQEYTGDIYASHIANKWMTYNPYQYEETITGRGDYSVNNGNGRRVYAHATKRAKGDIPLQYNTCESIHFDYAPYSIGLMTEYADKIEIYLQNYRKQDSTSDMRELEPTTDTIRVSGVMGNPAFEWTDRAKHVASEVTSEFNEGMFTVVVKHNGPLDLTISCQGDAEERLSDYKTAQLIAPKRPEVYLDTLEYQAEFMDYKSIAANRTNGYHQGHDGYRGQGFVDFGSNSAAGLRDTIWAPAEGAYKLKIRYQAPNTNVTMRAKVAGAQKAVAFRKNKEWTWTQEYEFNLKEGANVFLFSFVTTYVNTYIDCVQLMMTEETREAYLKKQSNPFDVNEDGSVDISDVVAVINHIAGTANYPKSDVNADNHTDISDIVAVINQMAAAS